MANDERAASARAEPMGAARVDPTTASVPATASGSTNLAERVPFGLVLRWAVAATIGVVGVLLVAYGLYVVRTILVLVLIALFLAISLEPVVRWLTRRGLRRPIAVTLVIVVVLVLIGLFVWSIVPPIVTQGDRLLGDLPGYLRTLSERYDGVREVTDRYNLTDRLNAVVAGAPAALAGGFFGFVQWFLGTIAAAGTVLVLMTYFMAAMPRLQQGVVRLFPPQRRDRVSQIVDVVAEKVGGYMIGNIIISLLAGAASFVCLRLVGVPFALPLAVVVAIADLIPMIGATLGAAVCVLVSLVTVGPWPQAVIVLAFFVIYQQVENYLFVPHVFRNTVDMPAVAVLLVALVGGSLFGLVGAIMAIPIVATVRVVMSPMIPAMDRPAPEAAPAATPSEDPEDQTRPAAADEPSAAARFARSSDSLG